MRKKNTEKLSDVLSQVLKQNQLDEKFFEKRVLDSWGKVLGEVVSSYTTSLYFRNHLLYVKISSAVLRNELFLEREKIKNSLNEYVQLNAVKEIIFQ